MRTRIMHEHLRLVRGRLERRLTMLRDRAEALGGNVKARIQAGAATYRRARRP